jgi:PhnB protein
MQWYPHLAFNGQCETAFQFYEKCLGGKIIFLMRYAEAPMDTPPEMKKQIIHATFAVGDQMFSGSDAMPGHYLQPQGFHIQLNLKDTAEATHFQDAGGKRLSTNGTAGNILGAALRRARGPVRYAMGNQLREGGLGSKSRFGIGAPNANRTRRLLVRERQRRPRLHLCISTAAHIFSGTSAEFWLNLQSLYELRLAQQKAGKSIKSLPRLKRPEPVHA